MVSQNQKSQAVDGVKQLSKESGKEMFWLVEVRQNNTKIEIQNQPKNWDSETINHNNKEYKQS